MYEIKSKYCLIKQEGNTAMEYYLKLKGLWDELENDIELATCTPGAAKKSMALWKKEKIYRCESHEFCIHLIYSYTHHQEYKLLHLKELATQSVLCTVSNVKLWCDQQTWWLV